jgi:hypothetical protein
MEQSNTLSSTNQVLRLGLWRKSHQYQFPPYQERKMSQEAKEEPKNLYSITGNVLDINTLLVNRNEYKQLVSEAALGVSRHAYLNDHLKCWIDEGLPAPVNELQSIQAWLRESINVPEMQRKMRQRMHLLANHAFQLNLGGPEAEAAAGIYDRRPALNPNPPGNNLDSLSALELLILAAKAVELKWDPYDGGNEDGSFLGLLVARSGVPSWNIYWNPLLNGEDVLQMECALDLEVRPVTVEVDWISGKYELLARNESRYRASTLAAAQIGKAMV